MKKFEPYRRAFADIGPILVRHIFLLVNGIIFAVVVLLSVFGNMEAALFLGVIICFNILLGVVQDTRARIALESLQMLTALRVLRIESDGSETSVLAEDIKKNDQVKLRLGDQVPCDGVMVSAEGMEVSEALLTGESDSFPRNAGEGVRAGDIVTAGTGILQVQMNFSESKMAQMTIEAKKYSAKPSPIQSAIERVIKYSGYVLLVILVFVVVRGFFVHEAYVDMVMNAGALASIIVPQGLVVITTLLFAFGASSYARQHVLFQEINATEKLGRIKNLCMDKTGTLTDNFLVVENMYVPAGMTKEEGRALVVSYIHGSHDLSQTTTAVLRYFGVPEEDKGTKEKIIEMLSFSSWRQFGAVHLRGARGEQAVFVGAPDIFLPFLSDENEKTWLAALILEHAHQGKRMLCVARAHVALLPRTLAEANLSLVAVFVFQSGLRAGIQDTITFFQERGVRIRIISGDNPDTARVVALAAGVAHADLVVTGAQMRMWSAEEFDERVRAHTIFARILPEQKVQIIDAFKKDGFTAMVGDGANDALAIKRADLGIAMFDGAPATRRLAGVILMNNSFAALPGGVKLADNFISNIEIFAAIFINQSLLGFYFFLIISLFGYAFPLTPLNITLINYFTVGIPGMLIGYWALRPSGNIPPTNSETFLSRVMPFILYSAAVEAIAVATVFALCPDYLKNAESNTLVLLAFMFCGFVIFALAPSVYRGQATKEEKYHIALLGVMEFFFLLFVLHTPLLVYFFNITLPYPAFSDIGRMLLVLILFVGVEYLLARKFFRNKKISEKGT